MLGRHRLIAAAVIALAIGMSLSPATVAGGDKPFIWPTHGVMTQDYGCTGFWAEPPRGSCAHFHGGIDIANKRGTPIRAAADGVLVHVGWDPWLRRDPDWMVIIKHRNGLRTVYAHLIAKPVAGIKEGNLVVQGQLIGLMGATGRATGVHLHWSVILDRRWSNPRLYVDGSP